MKILKIQQIREADEYTIVHEPISSIDLMERAARKCFEWILSKFTTDFHFYIFCGKGNNGGDGLAIARMLANSNHTMTVLLVEHSLQSSHDFTINLDRLKKDSAQNPSVSIFSVTNEQDLQTLDLNREKAVVIDAILGSGLNKVPEGITALTIDFINQLPFTKISIDIPTGLFADDNSENNFKHIVNADYTLTFQMPKYSFLFPETGKYAGEFEVLDIGLHKSFIQEATTLNFYITQEVANGIIKKRNKFSHKGTYGHALIMGGSYGKVGAALLSAKACLRTGCGLVTAYIPKCGYDAFQSSFPECMVITSDQEKYINSFFPKMDFDAIGIGPGIGMEKDTQNALKFFIQNNTAPVVYDADAINSLAENKTWLSFIKPGSIFTPHPKELERLTGKAKDSTERLQLASDFAFKYNCYVVLKGAHTCVVCPDKTFYFNSTGNPGMATAGSGDVLTGIITSLLAQGYTSKEACILGVYIHGLAGDVAAQKTSMESLIAGDIIENLNHPFSFQHNL